MITIKNFLFSTSLLLALFIGLNFVAIARDFPIQPNANGVYEINNIADLNNLSDYVNNVDSVATLPPAWTSAGKTFILMDDIDGFSKPIGTQSRPFLGTFDGNGRKITLSINSNTTKYCGVFGYTSNAVIKNLTSSGEINHSNSNRTVYVAGIVAYNYRTPITNCNNYTTISVNGISGNSYAGGIVGYGQYGTGAVSTKSCVNFGAISVSNVDDTSYVGGIVAYGTTALRDSIVNCQNLGDIDVNNVNYSNLGGITGCAIRLPVVTCSNSGTIASTEACVGGIVGYGVGNKLSQCLNTGKIKGQSEVGGLIGRSSIYNIDNCANAGWVNGDSKIGGFIGSLHSLVSMQFCLNTGVVQGDTNVYALIGQRYNNYSLTGKVTHCYYDNQMAPLDAIQGMTNPTSVHSRSTSELTQPLVRDVLGDAWTMYPPPNIATNPPAGQIYSYPVIRNIDNNLSYVAAVPTRLINGEHWNSVSEGATLDVGYFYYSSFWNVLYEWPGRELALLPSLPPSPGLEWQADKLTIGYVMASFNGFYTTGAGNSYSYEGLSTLTVSRTMPNGYVYKKIVPIITTGVPFKIPVNNYATYSFEASEVTPNIVTNNAVIDINTATEGNLNIAIFDVSGSEVMHVTNKHVTAQSQTQVELNNLHNLPTGSYMVAVSVGNNVIFKKFIKQ